MTEHGVRRTLGASYELLEPVGEGATGDVWRGVDRRTGETVAIKVLRPEHLDDDTMVARFVRERTVLLGLRDPNVVAVRELVVDGDRLAIVMDHVDGGSLRAVLTDGGPLRPAVALGVVAAVLDGLAAAHDRHVVHRDVKPDNVLLRSGWRTLQPGAVRLSDFGIAEILAEPTGNIADLVGTPEYLAPEVLLTGVAAPAADVYAAGASLYELLGGRTPFAGPGTGYEVAYRHVTNEVPRLPLPDHVRRVVAELLAPDPARRPTAGPAAATLRRVAASVGDLPALPAQADPAAYVSATGPRTEVRGLVAPGSSDTDRLPDEPVPDLGLSGRTTVIRSTPAPPPTTGSAPGPGRSTRRRRGSPGPG